MPHPLLSSPFISHSFARLMAAGCTIERERWEFQYKEIEERKQHTPSFPRLFPPYFPGVAQPPERTAGYSLPRFWNLFFHSDNKDDEVGDVLTDERGLFEKDGGDTEDFVENHKIAKTSEIHFQAAQMFYVEIHFPCSFVHRCDDQYYRML